MITVLLKKGESLNFINDRSVFPQMAQMETKSYRFIIRHQFNGIIIGAAEKAKKWWKSDGHMFDITDALKPTHLEFYDEDNNLVGKYEFIYKKENE